MDKIEVVIIGAGVVGLAIASELSSRGKDVMLIERHKSFGCETSSRNSEVIHGGMYYPTGSLKADLCVEGRRLLYEICEAHSLSCRKLGKLICAVCPEEQAELERIYELGKKNGVENLSFLSAGQVRAMEPDVRAVSALFSPETGIIDSHKLMDFYLEMAKKGGALCLFGASVRAVEKIAAGYRVQVDCAGSRENIECDMLVNSAGLDSDTIAEMAGIDVSACGYRLKYCKGEYFRVSGRKSSRISRLIYPVPKPKSAGLGVHATLDLKGGMRLGPDTRYSYDRIQDYSVDQAKLDEFYHSAAVLMPFLERSDLAADTAGIRPKLQGPGEDFRDFIISEESDKGFPGLINLIGIESPGLTASPAIARVVAGLAR